jgi:hypothetical protein
MNTVKICSLLVLFALLVCGSTADAQDPKTKIQKDLVKTQVVTLTFTKGSSPIIWRFPNGLRLIRYNVFPSDYGERDLICAPGKVVWQHIRASNWYLNDRGYGMLEYPFPAYPSTLRIDRTPGEKYAISNGDDTMSVSVACEHFSEPSLQLEEKVVRLTLTDRPRLLVFQNGTEVLQDDSVTPTLHTDLIRMRGEKTWHTIYEHVGNRSVGVEYRFPTYENVIWFQRSDKKHWQLRREDGVTFFPAIKEKRLSGKELLLIED